MTEDNITKRLLAVNSDETCSYRASFKVPPTLEEFVQYLLTEQKGEWGDVYLNNWSTHFLEYRSGEIVAGTLSYYDNKDRHISLGGMNGGWGAMDYMITFADSSAT